MDIGALAATSATTSAGNGIGLQDFMKILLTQLSYQDPLKPMDNQQFMAQVAQFTALEQTQQVNDKLGQLLANQAALQSVGLVGRTVDVQTDAGAVSGTVTALTLQGQAPALSVTTAGGTVLQQVALGQLLAVH